MAGRIESYIHSDSVTPNKGGALVEVTCETDFCARSEEFVKFCKLVAKMVFAFDAKSFESLVEHYPEIENIKSEAEKTLGEKIILRQASRMILTSEEELRNEKDPNMLKDPFTGFWHRKK